MKNKNRLLGIVGLAVMLVLCVGVVLAVPPSPPSVPVSPALPQCGDVWVWNTWESCSSMYWYQLLKC